jgi:hypothetical protein
LSDLKQQAEALRIGLLARYVEPDEVVAWADGAIAAGDVPGPELIEVSLGGVLPVDELARALKAIPGEISKPAVARTVLSQMAAALRRDSMTCRGIVQALYQMSLDELAPSPDARAEMLQLDDELDLAESGTYGSLQDVHVKLTRFLSEWAE